MVCTLLNFVFKFWLQFFTTLPFASFHRLIRLFLPHNHEKEKKSKDRLAGLFDVPSTFTLTLNQNPLCSSARKTILPLYFGKICFWSVAEHCHLSNSSNILDLTNKFILSFVLLITLECQSLSQPFHSWDAAPYVENIKPNSANLENDEQKAKRMKRETFSHRFTVPEMWLACWSLTDNNGANKRHWPKVMFDFPFSNMLSYFRKSHWRTKASI